MIYGNSGELILDMRQHLNEPFISTCSRVMQSNTGGVPCDGEWSCIFVDAWKGSIEDAQALHEAVSGKPDGLAIAIRAYAFSPTPPTDLLCAGAGRLTQLDVVSVESGVPVVQCEAHGNNGLGLKRVFDLTLTALHACLSERKALLRSLSHRTLDNPEMVEQLKDAVEFVEYYLSETPDPSPKQNRMLLERLQ